MKRRAAALCALTVLSMAVTAGSAHAEPPTGVPDAVVALGDSAISGEAGRWAGNTNNSPSRVDALGSTAYHDVAGRESTPGCHRSKAAEIHIGGIESANLACSGARTYTQPYSSGSDFKPGLDFYDDGAGHVGQAKALQQYAATHRVRLIMVLISANNFGFADVVQTCVTDWLTSPSWWKNYCNDDASIRSRFTDSFIAQQRDATAGAYANIRKAMTDAGYAASRTTGSSRRPTRPRSRAAAASATRRPASRARRSAAAASGTATPTGPTTRWSRRSTSA